MPAQASLDHAGKAASAAAAADSDVGRSTRGEFPN